MLKGYDKHILVAQELESLGFGKTDSVVDIVRSDDADRPKLEELINSLSNKDRIDMYSIDTLLQGNSNKGVEYYRRILEKGIALMIFDFSGRICKLSEFSNLKYNSNGDIMFKDTPIEEQVAAFRAYAESKKKAIKCGSFKKKRGTISDAFIDIYFAYESYQIDLPTALKLANQYCNIQHKTTFWALSIDYEKSTGYDFDLEIYSNLNNGILNMPKRSGGIPAEFFEITKKMSETDDNISYMDKYCYAVNELGYFLSYHVFHRWKLAYEKKPKPRKPIVTTFDIKEFMAKYQPCNA